MKTISLSEVENGYKVRIVDGGKSFEYVFRSDEILRMLAFVGKTVNGKKVYVTEG
jgi:hypothetical protein